MRRYYIKISHRFWTNKRINILFNCLCLFMNGKTNKIDVMKKIKKTSNSELNHNFCLCSAWNTSDICVICTHIYIIAVLDICVCNFESHHRFAIWLSKMDQFETDIWLIKMSNLTRQFSELRQAASAPLCVCSSIAIWEPWAIKIKSKSQQQKQSFMI